MFWSFERDLKIPKSMFPGSDVASGECPAPTKLTTQFDYSVIGRLFFPVIALLIGFAAGIVLLPLPLIIDWWTGQGVRFSGLIYRICFGEAPPEEVATSQSDSDDTLLGQL